MLVKELRGTESTQDACAKMRVSKPLLFQMITGDKPIIWKRLHYYYYYQIYIPPLVCTIHIGVNNDYYFIQNNEESWKLWGRALEIIRNKIPISLYFLHNHNPVQWVGMRNSYWPKVSLVAFMPIGRLEPTIASF